MAVLFLIAGSLVGILGAVLQLIVLNASIGTAIATYFALGFGLPVVLTAGFLMASRLRSNTMHPPLSAHRQP